MYVAPSRILTVDSRPVKFVPFFSHPNTAVLLSANVTVPIFVKGSDPFVFAFRLRHIKVSLAGNIQHADFSKGAVLNLNGSRPDVTEEVPKVIVGGVEDFDVDGDEFQLDSRDPSDGVWDERRRRLQGFEVGVKDYRCFSSSLLKWQLSAPSWRSTVQALDAMQRETHYR